MEVVSKSQLGGVDQPRNRSAWLTQPSRLSIWFQISTPATNGTTYGRNQKVRMSCEPKMYLLLSPSATTNGTRTATGSQMTANRKVLARDSQTCVSPSNRT